jgi:predicted dehydrogenase
MLKRVLVVGLGSIGKRHVRLVREIVPNVTVVGLSRQSLIELKKCGIDDCVTSIEEALKFRPQAAVIANPSSEHVRAALPLAEASVHLLIEKPISNTVAGVPQLIDVCRSRGNILLVGYNLRFMRSLQFFRETLQEKHIGKVLSVRAEIGQFLPTWRPGADYRQGVSARAELGGGVLLELSHEIDYLRWLFGEVEWVSAVQRRQSRLEIDVEDTAHLIFGFSSTPGDAALVGTLNMDFIRHDATRTCTAIGETGTLRWNALSGTVESFEPGREGWRLMYSEELPKEASYLAEWRHFLACISEGIAPAVSGADALAVLQTIEAARQSSAKETVTYISRDDKRPGGRGISI